MLTGVETAGLVLATLPLVVSGLEHYAEGVSTVVKWWSYKRELASLIRLLDAEYAQFLTTCEKLLEDLVPPSKLKSLIDEPGGILWQDQDLDRKLRMRLQQSYSAYIRSIEDMKDAVNELVVKLELDETGKPQWGEYHSFKNEYKRVKFSISRRRYEEAMKRIEKNNNILNNLTNQNIELGPARKRRQRSGPRFKTIQENAVRLYDCLNNQGWACGCEVAHCANLRLDARLDDVALDEELPGSKIDFRIVLSLESKVLPNPPWSWQAMDIHLLELLPDAHYMMQEKNDNPSSPSIALNQKDIELHGPFMAKSNFVRPIETPSRPSRPRKGVSFGPDVTVLVKSKEQGVLARKDVANFSEIDDICLAMQRLMEQIPYNRPCLGYLSHKKHRLAVYLPDCPQTQLNAHNTRSLADLLSQTAPTNRAPFIANSGSLPLNRGERLGLALIVASSVLQLYKTPWLREFWDKSDILVKESREKNVCDWAFVSRKFPESASTIAKSAPRMMYPWLRNATLFALGIVLIELCLGQDLGAMRTSDDPLNANGEADATTDYTTANRLLEAVYSEAGTRYGDAVRRCLCCDFDQRNTNLDDDTFRQAVYNGVVALLEDDVKDFYQL